MHSDKKPIKELTDDEIDDDIDEIFLMILNLKEDVGNEDEINILRGRLNALFYEQGVNRHIRPLTEDDLGQ